MVTKDRIDTAPSKDPRLRAGDNAERQMAYYLRAAFAQDRSVHVINDLRLEDPNQTDPGGRPMAHQIDHLVIHRRGLFIIESKSVSNRVTVEPDGTGGDEWSRTYKGRREGMRSPIKQARMQGEFLRQHLQANRESLLGKMPTGLRTLSKLLSGDDQRGFKNIPIQVIVAISDSGNIDRRDGWEAPTEPFRFFICKADQVTDKISAELDAHRASASLLGKPDGQYGMWSMSAAEAAAVAAFLADSHTPRTSRPPPAPTPNRTPAPEPPTAPTRPACKHCASAALTANWGKYGYYWRCADCDKNTSMPSTCSACGQEGHRGKGVRIRKDGPKYYRDCEACGISERIWTERSA